MGFRESILEIAPRWLVNTTGGALLRTFGGMFDALSTQLRDGIKARLPEYAPEDALGYLGNDRSIDKGPSESNFNYRQRLIRAVPANKQRGSGPELLRQLAGYFDGQGEPALRLVSNRTSWHEYHWDTGTVTKAIAGNDWTWDDHTDRWWRGWVIIEGEAIGIGPPLEMGDPGGGVFGDDGVMGASGVTEEEIVSLQRIVQRWKPANVHAVRIIVPFESYIFERHGSPATLADLELTAYLADFDGGTWEGLSSEGPSDTADFAPGAAPAVGANFNTHPSADFNGTTHYLVGPAVSSLFTTTAYFYEVVFEADTAAAINADPLLEETIFCDAGSKMWLTFSASGVRAGHDDGAKKSTAYVAAATGTKHCVQVWFVDGFIWLRLNGGTPVSVAAGAVSSLAGLARLGANSATSAFFDGKMALLAAMNSVPNYSTRISMRATAGTYFSTVAHAAEVPNPSGDYDDPANWTEDAAFFLSGGEEPED